METQLEAIDRGRDRKSRQHVAVLIAIVCLGSVLRTVMLQRGALWGDEALSLAIASFTANELIYKPVDPSPALYYLVQKAWLPLGDAPWIVRLPSWFAGILTIPVGYWLGRVSAGRKAGLVTALIIAVYPVLIDYSQEARAYAFLVLFEAVAIAAFLQACVSDPSKRFLYLFISSIFAVLAIYTHVTAWILVVPMATFALVWGIRKRWYTPWRLAGFLTFGFIVVLPEIVRIFDYREISQLMLPQPSLYSVSHLYARFIVPIPVGEPSSLNGPFNLSVSQIMLIGVAGLTMVIAWAVYFGSKFARGLITDPLRAEVSFVIVCLLIVHPVILYLVGFVTPMVADRTAIPFALGVALLVGTASSRLNNNYVWISLLVLMATELALFGTARAKPRYDEVANALRERPSLPVLFCSDWQGAAVAHAYHQAGGLPRRSASLMNGELVEFANEEDKVGDWVALYAERSWHPRVNASPLDRRYVQPPSRYPEMLLVDTGCSAERRSFFEDHYAASGERILVTHGRSAPLTLQRYTLKRTSER